MEPTTADTTQETVVTETPETPVVPETPETPPETPPVPETPVETDSEQPPTPPETPAEPETQVERVVPEADGYTLPEGVPPEIGAFANANGFTQEQLDASLEQFGGIVQASNEAEQLAVRQGGEALLDSWGPQKKENLITVRAALKEFDPDGEFKAALESSGYGNSAIVMNYLLNVGSVLKEGGYLKSAINTPAKSTERYERMYPNDVPKK